MCDTIDNLIDTYNLELDTLITFDKNIQKSTHNTNTLLRKSCICAFIVTLICLLDNPKYANYMLNTNPINAMAIYLQEFIKEKILLQSQNKIDFMLTKSDLNNFEEIVSRLGFTKLNYQIFDIYRFIVEIFSLEKITVTSNDSKYDIDYIELNKKNNTHKYDDENDTKHLYKVSDHVKHLDYVINGCPTIVGINLLGKHRGIDLTKRITPKTTNFLTKDKWNFSSAMCINKNVEFDVNTHEKQIYGLIKKDNNLVLIEGSYDSDNFIIKYQPILKTNNKLHDISIIQNDLVFAWYINYNFC